MDASRPSQPRRLVVRGVNWLGDAVMSTPALLRLRERFPEAYIALLSPEKLRDLWLAAPKQCEGGLHHPAVNEVIGFEAGEGLFSVGRKLREKSFDLALVLPNSPRAALEVWLAGVPQRIGYARPWRNWFLTKTVPTRAGHVPMHKRPVAEIKRLIHSSTAVPQSLTLNSQPFSAHQIHEYLQLASILGTKAEPLPPRLVVADDEVKSATEQFGLTDALAGGRPIFALAPGAEYGPAKRWPIGRFIAAIQVIQKRTNCLWLVLGGKADTSLAGQIAASIRHPPSAILDLAGRTSLRDLMALLKLCRVLLANDTGPMHVAAALGTPVVGLFGSTAPELTAPGLPGDPRHRLLKSGAPCSPCFLRECPVDFRCMTGIPVERVVEAVLGCSGAGRVEQFI